MSRILAPACAALILLGGSGARAYELGVMLDAGVPDGANASLVYRPWGFLRLHAGGGTNLISPGVRGGLSLLLPGGLSGTVEGGHYFEGNANGVWKNFSGATSEVPALRELGYDYANFRLGLELGPRWCTFFIQAGMSYVTGQVKQLGPTLTKVASSDGATVTFASDPTLSIWAVSARAGFIVAFGL